MSKKDKKKKREISQIREYFELFAETAVFVFFVMTFVVQAFQIPTGSMEDTLLIGDHLLVNKFVYASTYFSWERRILPIKDIKRGDIVVFRYPEDPTKDFVKRVIALGGESIEIKDKEVFINGKPINEPYKVHKDISIFKANEYIPENAIIRDNFSPITVPENQYFVMGDNRDNSSDSRYWGFLPRDMIKGKPWIIYWSYKAKRGEYLEKSFTKKIWNIVETIITFIPKTRWERFFKIIK
ncbi:MAG: signal peptidase I [Candidatus Aminicenantia bacterium]